MPHISRAVGSRKAVPTLLTRHSDCMVQRSYSTAQVLGYDESGRSAGSQRNSSSFYESSTVAPTFRPNAASGRRRGGVMGNMPLASAASGENTWLATRILMEIASIFAGGGVEQTSTTWGENRWSASWRTPWNRRLPPRTPPRRNGFRLDKPVLDAALRHPNSKPRFVAGWPLRGLSPMKMRPSSPPGKRGRTRTIGRKGPEFTAVGSTAGSGDHAPDANQTLHWRRSSACNAVATEDDLCA